MLPRSLLNRAVLASARAVAPRTATSRLSVRVTISTRSHVAFPRSLRCLSSGRGYSAAAAAPRQAEDSDDFFSSPVEGIERIEDISADGSNSRSSPQRDSGTTAAAPFVAGDGFFDSPASTSSNRTSSSFEPDTEGESPRAQKPKFEKPPVEIVPFTSLKGRINHDTLKALTFKPFQLAAMSEVQKRVLSLMPGLTESKLRGEAKEAVIAAGEDVEKAEVGAGRTDLLVKAKTGTGKTIAFLVPAIDARFSQLDRLSRAVDVEDMKNPGAQRGSHHREISRSHAGTLIISPTRELATQIANEAIKVCTWNKEMAVHLFVGGESRGNQLRMWRKNRKDIIVATPGRMNDMLSEPSVLEAIERTDLLILDEADTLLEMGFKKELQDILSCLPKERQTFLFSATVSPAIAQIARASLKPNHMLIDCVPKNESNVHLHIPQYYSVVTAEQQLPHVLRLIAQDQLQNPESKIILFLPTTKMTMLMATMLRELRHLLPDGLEVREIHAGLSQERRSRASERFRRDRRASVLVTTDVSARGVDYPAVTRVIQVGVPTTPEQYVHRVGRTGRGGKTGGRGDLVMLPWETPYLEGMRNIPIKQMEVDELATSLTELSPEGYAEKLAKVDSTVAEFVPTLDPEAINEVFTSLLGYYAGRREQLDVRASKLVDEIKDWAVLAGGLEERPRISEAMLTKMGLKDRGGFGGGRFGGGGGGRSGGYGGGRGGAGGFGGRDRDGGSRGGFGSGRGFGRSGGFGASGGDRDVGGRGGFGGESGERRGFGGGFGGSGSDRPQRFGGGDRDRSDNFGGGERSGGFGGARDFGGDAGGFGGFRSSGSRGGDREGAGDRRSSSPWLGRGGR